MAPVVEARELHKTYPGCPPVLRGASLTVESGEMVAVMGPSGCGKSTMLHVLGLLHAPDSGNLVMLGQDIMELDREGASFFRRRNLGFVMQSSNLFDFSTVYENVEFPLIYNQVPLEERRERILRALALVHLSDRVEYRSNRLSGGEQQRVAIARAMVNNPRILFADEPTGALDARTSKSIMTSFRSLAHNAGVSMVVVTHDPTVADFCDSVYTLDDGRLTCRKKEAVPPPEGEAFNLLIPDLPEVPRLMNVVCVGGRFPRLNGTTTRRLLLRLYDSGLVSKVYSSHGRQRDNADGMPSLELPMPVRHVGVGGLPAAVFACFEYFCSDFQRLRELWRTLPVGSRRFRGILSHAWNFLCGVLMARWCVEDDVELLHALSVGGPATAAWVASELTGVPFAFTVRAVDLAYADPSLPQKARAAFAVRCDTEIALAAVRAACPELPAERFLLLRSGLTFPDSDVQARLGEKAHRTGAHGISLLAVGTLTGRKGFNDLLLACALLYKENVNFHCRIVGEGKLKRRLRFTAWRLGLAGKVEFTGQVPHDHIHTLMAGATIFVAPGVVKANGGQDGLPTALAEAMQHALPVIVTDIAGQMEAVQNGVSGLVIPQRAPRELADAILRLSSEPDTARKLGQAARVWALEHLDAERCGEAIIQRLLEARAFLRKTLDARRETQ